MLNRLEMLRIFCVTAESPSFKAAAARLSTSPQTITRAVKELEDLVGEPLFHRDTRRCESPPRGRGWLSAHARH